MSPIINALSDLLYEKNDCCKLCFEPVSDKALLLQDKIITNNQWNITKLCDILTLVLGDEIQTYFSSRSRVCKECVQTALMSYNFISTCKENFHKLSKCIESLSEGLENTNEGLGQLKSMFLTVNTNDFSNQKYYSYKKASGSLTQVLKEFKMAMKPKKAKKRKIVTIAKVEDDSDDTEFTSNGIDLIEELEESRKVYYCNFCPKKYNSINNLKKHNKNEHKRGPFVCSYCGKTFQNFTALKIHEQHHSNIIPCAKCSKVYKGKFYFKQHICTPEQERPLLAKKFACDDCGVKFARLPSLSIHIKYEHGSGVPLICEWCSKKFYSLSMLKQHERKHTKEKNFKCEMCGGYFVSKASLTYHTRTHTGEKPYKCKYCDLKFLSSSRRADHARVNHLEPRLTCDICHKKFKLHTTLNTHRKRHANPKSSLYIKSEVVIKEEEM